MPAPMRVLLLERLKSAEVFLGIYEGTQKEALKAAADNWEVPESNIRLVEIET